MMDVILYGFSHRGYGASIIGYRMREDPEWCMMGSVVLAL